jgi:transposase
MIPIYTKPNAPKRRKKPGARQGHPGARRQQPVNIDERKTQRLKCCPHCDGKLQRCERSRTRIIEDLPEAIEPVVTEHTIHRDYCPKCKKHVEPIVPDAMPKAALGHRVIALTSWFHYGLRLTID